MAKIIPGILTADEKDYHKRLQMAEHVSDLIQIDVVDGEFSANTTVGTDIIKKYPTSSQLEIQLMVIYPLNYIDELARLDCVSRIIFPFEIDIGVNFENAAKLASYGADFLVASSALYNAPDFYLAYEKLAKLANLTVDT